MSPLTRKLGGGFLVVALLLSLVANVQLWRRLGRLERVVAAREAADPLMPAECAIDDNMGKTRERPCQVDFERLRLWPRQFVGRWVLVTGRFEDGFEMSALFARDEAITDASEDRLLRERRGVWVDTGYRKGRDGQIVNVVGNFKPGPAGHLGMYFGELAEAVLIP